MKYALQPHSKIPRGKIYTGLTFAPHAEEVSQKVSKRTNLIRAVATPDWGWQKMTLRQIYIAIQRSVLDYAAAARQPNLRQTNFDKLERSQNKALRVIPGQALHKESGVSSYRTHSNRLIASSHQKPTRTPPDHPRTQILDKLAPNRLKRSSWRKQSEELNKIPSNSHTEPKTNSASEPPAIALLQRLARQHHSHRANLERNFKRSYFAPGLFRLQINCLHRWISHCRNNRRRVRSHFHQ